MTTCENCDSHEFTCAGCGVLQKPDDFPCCSKPAPSSSQSGNSDMDIPEGAVEAGAEELKHWSFPRSPEFLARSVLEAAFPHLRPLFQHATQVGYELGRREAKIEHAGMLEARASGEGLSTATRGVLRGMASTIARDLTKGDPK